MNVTQKLKFVSGRVGNILGKAFADDKINATLEATDNFFSLVI